MHRVLGLCFTARATRALARGERQGQALDLTDISFCFVPIRNISIFCSDLALLLMPYINFIEVNVDTTINTNKKWPSTSCFSSATLAHASRDKHCCETIIINSSSTIIQKGLNIGTEIVIPSSSLHNKNIGRQNTLDQ